MTQGGLDLHPSTFMLTVQESKLNSFSLKFSIGRMIALLLMLVATIAVGLICILVIILATSFIKLIMNFGWLTIVPGIRLLICSTYALHHVREFPCNESRCQRICTGSNHIEKVKCLAWKEANSHLSY